MIKIWGQIFNRGSGCSCSSEEYTTMTCNRIPSDIFDDYRAQSIKYPDPIPLRRANSDSFEESRSHISHVSLISSNDGWDSLTNSTCSKTSSRRNEPKYYAVRKGSGKRRREISISRNRERIHSVERERIRRKKEKKVRSDSEGEEDGWEKHDSEDEVHFDSKEDDLLEPATSGILMNTPGVFDFLPREKVPELREIILAKAKDDEKWETIEGCEDNETDLTPRETEEYFEFISKQKGSPMQEEDQTGVL